jgi:hypothetical protein
MESYAKLLFIKFLDKKNIRHQFTLGLTMTDKQANLNDWLDNYGGIAENIINCAFSHTNYAHNCATRWGSSQAVSWPTMSKEWRGFYIDYFDDMLGSSAYASACAGIFIDFLLSHGQLSAWNDYLDSAYCTDTYTLFEEMNYWEFKDVIRDTIIVQDFEEDFPDYCVDWDYLDTEWRAQFHGEKNIKFFNKILNINNEEINLHRVDDSNRERNQSGDCTNQSRRGVLPIRRGQESEQRQVQERVQPCQRNVTGHVATHNERVPPMSGGRTPL